MRFLSQAVIIAGVTAAAELIKFLVPLPVPASIYGLALMFLLLKTGLVKLRQVEDVGRLLLELMPLFLIPPSVSFIQATGNIGGILLPVLLISFGGTALVMVVTARVAQWIIRRERREKGHG